MPRQMWPQCPLVSIFCVGLPPLSMQRASAHGKGPRRRRYAVYPAGPHPFVFRAAASGPTIDESRGS
eukprot:4796356-Pyramimonas_sp.AAC.1